MDHRDPLDSGVFEPDFPARRPGIKRRVCPTPRYVKNQDIYVGCGQCNICRKTKASQRVLRYIVHFREFPGSGFHLTLTYSDDLVPRLADGLMTHRKSDFQKFMKRLRKALPDRRIQYSAWPDYAEATMRPHWHVLISGISSHELRLVDELWDFGEIHVQPLWIPKNGVWNLQFHSLRYVAHHQAYKVNGALLEEYLQGREEQRMLQSLNPPLADHYPPIYARMMESQAVHYLTKHGDIPPVVRIDGKFWSWDPYLKDRIRSELGIQATARDRGTMGLVPTAEDYEYSRYIETQLEEERKRKAALARSNAPTRYQYDVNPTPKLAALMKVVSRTGRLP